MTGGIIRYVTAGSQDYYLTGNPEISFFKTVYRRYTNFATVVEGMETVHQIEVGDRILKFEIL